MSDEEQLQADLETYEQEVRYWLGKLGLHDWKAAVVAADMDVQGRCRVTFIGRLATISLANDWRQHSIEVRLDPDLELRRTAFHEVAELMLMELGWMAEQAFAKDRVEEVQHTIIRRLENTVFAEDYQRRKEAQA